MGPEINTSFDEEAPFIYPDDSTFYFSSNRNRAKEGFDNFISYLLANAGWSAPINVGYPLHKTITESIPLKIEGDKEITSKKENYTATFLNQKRSPINIIKGKIMGTDEKVPKYIEVTISNNETGEVGGIYHPDNKTEKYMCMLSSGKNNNITYEADGYLFHSENITVTDDYDFYKLQQTIKLEPVAIGSKIILNNIFFNDSKPTLSSASDFELNKLYNFLNQHSKLIVEISSKISKKSTSLDVKLANERIQSVINFLSEKGIDRKNIKYRVYKNLNKLKIKSDEKGKSKNESANLELKILASN